MISGSVTRGRPGTSSETARSRRFRLLRPGLFRAEQIDRRFRRAILALNFSLIRPGCGDQLVPRRDA